MSAINVIQQTRQVHVLTDGAAYHPDGRLIMVGPKISIVPHLACAISFRGPKSARPVLTEVMANAASTYDGLKMCIGELLRDCAQIYGPLFDECRLGPDFEVIVSGWSEARGPEAYLLPTHNRYGGGSFEAMPLEGVTCLPNDETTHPEIVKVLAGLEADDVDPERHGLAVMEIQRAHPFAHEGFSEGFCGVGGFAQLTTVTADGISTRIVRRWPDVVGERFGSSTERETHDRSSDDR
jgi:hypothetical protein